MELQHKIALTYGDPYADGHGISETDYYMSSHTTSEIIDAVKQTERKLDFKWSSICADHAQCCLSQEELTMFKDAGISIDDYVDQDPEWLSVHDFSGLYLAVAELSLPDLETEFIKQDADVIDIDGYGMCSAG